MASRRTRPSDYEARLEQFKKRIDEDLARWESSGVERDLAALAHDVGSDEDIAGYYSGWTERDFKDLLEELRAHKGDRLAELEDKATARELSEMRDLLEAKGYDPRHAIDLFEEGMGPHELEDRLRHRPGSVGSLEHSHNIHRKGRK
jgi:hypothetical protein